MRRIIYDGPHLAVEVPDLDAIVQRGEVVEVTDDELAERLLEQAVWVEAPAPKARTRKDDAA